MDAEANVPVYEIVERLLRLRGRTFWQVWRSVGSHLWFETGEPLIRVTQRTNTRLKVNGCRVERRPTFVKGSHGLAVEMAAWTLSYKGQQVAHEESSDKTFRELAPWLTGQSLVDVVARGPTALDIEFDLGARLSVHPHHDQNDDEELLTVWDELGHITLRADGTVVKESDRNQTEP